MAWGGPRPNAGRKPVNGKAVATTKAPSPKAAPPNQLSFDGMERIIAASQQHARYKQRQPEFNPFRLPEFPPAALPPQNMRMAMDSAVDGWASEQWSGAYLQGVAAEGLLFLGYPYLAELAQRPEYRTISETIATEMTRKWIKFSTVQREEEKQAEKAAKQVDPSQEPDPRLEAEDRAPGEEPQPQKPPSFEKPKTESDKADNEKMERIRELEDFLNDLKIRDHFATIAEKEGYFGRMHLFCDSGADDAENMTPISQENGKFIRGKIGRNFLKRLQPIEPVWCYPTTYNATSPVAQDWYNPQVWYVMGKQYHRSRLPVFVGRPVPDMLKPAYAFGGLSLSQIAKPYVDIWLTTRQSVADLIHSFSVMVLMTDLSTLLQPGNSAALLTRAAMFNALRDNQGLMIVNKDKEDFKNVSASLSGLHELQAQSQEHMMSVARIPAVKFTGMQPQGLNASSEGEMRAFNDTIHAYQNRLFKPNLDYIIDIAQITLWGKKDPDIVYEFASLVELTDKEKGELKKLKAETGQIHIDTGVISPEEERSRIIDDPESDYQGLDPEDVPELKEEEQEGLVPGKGGAAVTAAAMGGGEGGEGGGQDANLIPFASEGAKDALFNNPDLDTAYWVWATEHRRVNPQSWPAPMPSGPALGGFRQPEETEPEVAEDAWSEADHPRGQPGNAGQFGSGGGGGSAKPAEGGKGSAEPTEAKGEAPGGEEPAFKTKKEHAAHLLEKGATAKQLMTALGWPSISVPATAKSVGMRLEKTKVGKETVYKGVPMTPEERKAAGLMPPGIKRSGGPSSRDPSTFSMLEYLASRGGIDPKDPLIGDVRSIIGTKNKFIPGFGMLIRPGGLRLDHAREAAIEAGYLTDAARGRQMVAQSDLNTLFEGMDQEARGNKLYQFGQRPEHVVSAEETARSEENRHRIEETLDHGMRESGVPELSDKQRARVIQIMEKEGISDPLEAIEREAMEWVNDASERGEAERILDDIPGWDVPDDARAAPQSSGHAAPF